MTKSSFAYRLLPLLGLFAFLLFWEAMPRLGLASRVLLPAPSDLPDAFIRELANGMWLKSFGLSLSHYTLGLLVGLGAGIGLGVLTGMSNVAEGLFAWVSRVLRPIPGLAWVPFAIIWFGVSQSGAVFIIAIGVFWIVYFATHGAIRGVDRDYIELAKAFGFTGPLERLFKVLLPAAPPGILVGARTALGQAWMAVVAELFGVTGLGSRMMQASSLLATDIVVVYMLTMAALYGLMDTFFMAVQGRLLRWKP